MTCTVNRDGTLNQFFGVEHVRGTARMHHRFGIWQHFEQLAGTAGMVEMHMCQEQVVDVSSIDIGLPQRIQQQRHAVVCSCVDKSGAACLNNEVAGVEQRADIVRIDGEYAIPDIGRCGNWAGHLPVTTVTLLWSA